jgi:hypothetical protein
MKQYRESLVVWKKDVDLTAPSHVPGVHEGNWPGRMKKRARQAGVDEDMTGDLERSTGINAEERQPIMAGMPKLSPP